MHFMHFNDRIQLPSRWSVWFALNNASSDVKAQKISQRIVCICACVCVCREKAVGVGWASSKLLKISF